MKFFYRMIVSLFCVAWLAKYFIIPLGVLTFNYSSYMQLVGDCSIAMESSWYIGKSDFGELSKSEQVQLLSCHDYDKTRKLLLTAGVSPEFLAYLGLLSLEINQRPIEAFVVGHRFIER